MTHFFQGDVIRFYYTHSNGNQEWERCKEGLFVKKIDEEYCQVLLLGNTGLSKVKISNIKRKDDINISKEMKLFDDEVRVNDSQIFSWKQVKQILKGEKRK